MRGSTHQPFGDHHLLLVAARQRADRHVGAVGLDGEQPDHLVDRAASRPALSMMPPLRRRGRARRSDRLSRTDIGSISPSVLRSSGISAMPMSSALGRRAGSLIATALAVDQDLAGSAAQHAEEREQQLALALAVEAAEADDLAGAHGERDVVAAGPSSRGRGPRAPAARRAAPAAGLRREDVAVFAADHHLDDFVVGLGAGRVGRDVAGRCGTPCTRRPVRRSRACGARCRAAPGPRRAAASARSKTRSTSADGQRRGRLVEDQDARLAGQRLGDLDHLPARQRQVLDQRERMDVGARRRAPAPPRPCAAGPRRSIRPKRRRRMRK